MYFYTMQHTTTKIALSVAEILSVASQIQAGIYEQSETFEEFDYWRSARDCARAAGAEERDGNQKEFVRLHLLSLSYRFIAILKYGNRELDNREETEYDYAVEAHKLANPELPIF